MNKKFILLVLGFLVTIYIFSETQEKSLFQKADIGLITVYQSNVSPLRLSSGSGSCRFHPTCSNYALQSIERYGFTTGFLMAFDRLQRCNPFGTYGKDLPENHYVFASNKIENQTDSSKEKKNIKRKSPTTAGILSIIPGMGKIYCGKTGDGLFSFFFISGLGYLTYDTYIKKAYSSTVIWGMYFATFYAGNIYGGIDAAKNCNRKSDE